MSKDLNLCQFIGHLGRDVETKYTAGGTAIANFSLGCSDDYKDKSGNWVNQTEWVRCVAFDKLAELIANKLSKGCQIYVSGKMKTRKWQDQDGNDRYSTEITVSDFQLLKGKSEDQPRPTGQDFASGNAPPPDMDSFDEDSIPF